MKETGVEWKMWGEKFASLQEFVQHYKSNSIASEDQDPVFLDTKARKPLRTLMARNVM